MLITNASPSHNQPLDPADAAVLTREQADKVERFLTFRENHAPTPLRSLARARARTGRGILHVKDESRRLGLGSFKALGGSYAVVTLLLEMASRELGRPVDISEIHTKSIREIASDLTVGCATDGNHGRSVAAGAQTRRSQSSHFRACGRHDERIAAIAQLGAEIMRVDGTYDDLVAVADQVCRENGWIVVSDTSWPGYERIPGLVMQGYTAMLNEDRCASYASHRPMCSFRPALEAWPRPWQATSTSYMAKIAPLSSSSNLSVPPASTKAQFRAS